MNRPIDISVLLGAEQQDFPGDPPFELRRVERIGESAGFELSRLSMSAHAGSHIDAPAHFLRGGKTIDAYGPERFLLPCLVLHLPAVETIGASDLERGASHFADADLERGASHFADAPPQGGALLLRTDNSDSGRARSGTFDPNFVAIDESAALWCRERGLSLLGLDAPSVERSAEGRFPVHRRLLEADILILEGLNLAEAPPGAYRLVCLPLRLKEAEASPTRAVLLRA